MLAGLEGCRSWPHNTCEGVEGRPRNARPCPALAIYICVCYEVLFFTREGVGSMSEIGTSSYHIGRVFDRPLSIRYQQGNAKPPTEGATSALPAIDAVAAAITCFRPPGREGRRWHCRSPVLVVPNMRRNYRAAHLRFQNAKRQTGREPRLPSTNLSPFLSCLPCLVSRLPRHSAHSWPGPDTP